MSWYRVVTTFIVLIFVQTSHQKAQYFWLDYNGTIPDNVIVGGYDSKGEEFYIGTTQLESKETAVVPIYPGIPYVKAPSVGITVQTTNSSLKILCGEEQPDWIRASADNLHVVLLDKDPVIAGTFKNQGNVHIGRISLDNEIKIGTIKSFDLNDAVLVLVHNNHILSTRVYEVLVYDSKRGRPSRRRSHRGRHH